MDSHTNIIMVNNLYKKITFLTTGLLTNSQITIMNIFTKQNINQIKEKK